MLRRFEHHSGLLCTNQNENTAVILGHWVWWRILCCGELNVSRVCALRQWSVGGCLVCLRVTDCDVCCCCVAGWHIWAQTPAGLLLASVGFHYSGAAAAAATEGSSPESLLSVTDVRLRSALVLPVESRPQPLQIVGVIGEVNTTRPRVMHCSCTTRVHTRSCMKLCRTILLVNLFVQMCSSLINV